MQRSQLDYLANPGPTNQLIVDLVNAYQTGWTYSAGVADLSLPADFGVISARFAADNYF